MCSFLLRWAICGLLCLSVAACRQPSRFQLRSWTAQQLPASMPLSAVQMLPDGRGWITGGDAYTKGGIFSTLDGGQNWQLDTLFNFRMEALMLDSNARIYAFGQWGTAYYWLEDRKRWENFMTEYRWLRAGSFPTRSQGMVVSGESFDSGEVQVNGPDEFWKKDTLITFPEQLMTVWVNSPTVAHVAGMGCLYRSADGGHHWERLPVTDDFFVDLHFPTATTGYCVGQNGSLYKTTDGGLQWAALRSSQTFGRNRPVLRSVWFYSENGGWLAGDNGLLWHTTDGGLHWEAADQPDSGQHFRDVIALPNGRGWVVSDAGSVYAFEWE
jgi:photosystem II stability/assembly factor-like uncharacterized protein